MTDLVPLDTERILNAFADRPEWSLTIKDLGAALGVSHVQRRELRSHLRRLSEEGLLERVGPRSYRLPLPDSATPATAASSREAKPRKSRYTPKSAQKPTGSGLTGIVFKHPAGHATVKVVDDEAQVFVRALDLSGALHGDTVRLEVLRRREPRGRFKETATGRVTQILSHTSEQITGTFHIHRGFAHVIPDDPRHPSFIPISRADTGEATPGEAVVVELVRPPAPADPRAISGRVLQILGTPGEPDAEIQKIIIQHGLRTEFHSSVLEEAESLKSAPTADEMAGREDLSDLPLVTIDGKDARDFDDAVAVQTGPHGGWTLTVAIADVAHYVSQESALDLEALERGNSVYFPRRVLPMLPSRLSNNLCSLKPGVPRLAMAVTLKVAPNGQVEDARFAEALIQSQARLTYEGVSMVLEGKATEAGDPYQAQHDHLHAMEACAKALNRRRVRRGTLDFDLPEPMVIFRESEEQDLSIIPRERSWAHRLIEEFMIAANEAVGAHLTALGIPAIFRVHNKPDPDKMEVFAGMAASFGHDLDLSKGRLTPRRLGTFLSSLEGKPEEKLLHTLALRSMAKAVYAVDDIGHFGLGNKAYAHFTSPIRRYPDLAVHRVLKSYLRGDLQPVEPTTPETDVGKHVQKLSARLSAVADNCSRTERKAMEAEYAVLDFYRAYVMKDRVGEVFHAVISGVLDFGFFVELQDPFVEGLVRLDALPPDRYQFDEARHSLKGEGTGVTYRLGDAIEVKLISVNVLRRHIDFAPVE